MRGLIEMLLTCIPYLLIWLLITKAGGTFSLELQWLTILCIMIYRMIDFVWNMKSYRS